LKGYARGVQASEPLAKVQNNITAGGGCATFIGIFVAPAPSPVIKTRLLQEALQLAISQAKAIAKNFRLSSCLLLILHIVTPFQGLFHKAIPVSQAVGLGYDLSALKTIAVDVGRSVRRLMRTVLGQSQNQTALGARHCPKSCLGKQKVDKSWHKGTKPQSHEAANKTDFVKRGDMPRALLGSSRRRDRLWGSRDAFQ
jgi:hypothetical protein